MLKEGLSFSSETIVDNNNIASALGSGDLAVFATPAMIALMENAAMKAVAAYLPEGSTTVGSEMNTTHIKPSGTGSTIVATAVLTEIDRRKLTFSVSAKDNTGIIGEGTHVRFIVDKEKFMSKL
ncbi:thioesterase family protein [Dysgonomonas macrotermitis]|uniref:Predicted thioesterase n=1 Tax=Dysgonomonas macrotermitis TaxID=1346286 RepID=A0A1M5GJ95_9BACT|nr:thioesterase family protein [Dysgonomonas macrotermitis]SHG03789.1 Predicted thioesterase [Dysgonomonas macrotermitis]